MSLPDSTETPRTLALRKIVEETEAEQIFDWPKLGDGDYALFARIIHIYSVFDFILHHVMEIMDKQGMLAPLAGKTQRLTSARVAEVIQLSPIWIGSNKFALEEIESYRRVRNLLAHFVARRFPDDNAYIFMTKSAIDYRRVYGKLPEGVDTMLYGVLDAQQLRDVVPVLEGLLKWAAQLPRDLSRPLDGTGGRV
ncbi:hypothetical protein [Nitrobacter sp. TKz-YC02]|uniref:hypothetical protein n=1 Tax=Nitrobacter sp. TKz-YC02 TaxID=3398704 RepID=UPI003CF33E10